MTQDKIILEGMIFFGFHGSLPEERTLGQRFVVDMELRCDLHAAGASDDLSKTVDYRQVYEQARAIVEGEPLHLIEAVAERIAAAVLRSQPLVESVRVKVAKPHVRLGATALAGSAVEIVRARQAGM